MQVFQHPADTAVFPDQFLRCLRTDAVYPRIMVARIAGKGFYINILFRCISPFGNKLVF